jgi:hypothetical protein
MEALEPHRLLLDQVLLGLVVEVVEPRMEPPDRVALEVVVLVQ